MSLGSPNRLDRKERLDKVMRDLEDTRAKSNRELNERLSRANQEIYADILAVVAECAKARQIDLVIKQEAFKPEPGAPPQAVMMQIGLQTVLYRKDSLDLTKEVTERLNARHQAALETAKDAAAEKK